MVHQSGLIQAERVTRLHTDGITALLAICLELFPNVPDWTLRAGSAGLKEDQQISNLVLMRRFLPD